MAIHAGRDYTDGAVSIGPPDLAAIRRAIPDSDVAPPITRWLAAAQARADVYYFGVVWRGRTVGQILLHDMDSSEGTALVAYHLFAARDRGQGVGTAALGLVLRFVMDATSLTRVVSITSRDNLASRRIAQKCGFTFAGAPREDPVNGVVYRWERPPPAGPRPGALAGRS
jgi:RimJ/RimL family protein N-acetyltransferase